MKMKNIMFWKEPSAWYIRTIIALLLFTTISQMGFCLSIEPECNITANSYVVMQSHLEYTDVSTVYAGSIYNDVRGIIWEYHC